MRALDLHLSAWEYFDTPGRAEQNVHSVMNGYGMDATEADQAAIERGYDPADSAVLYPAALRRLMNEARTIFVSAEMMPLVLSEAGVEFTRLDDEPFAWSDDPEFAHIAEERLTGYRFDLFQSDDHLPVLHPSMFSDPHGLVIFEDPLPYPDFDERIVREFGPAEISWLPVKAIGWETVESVSVHESDGTNRAAAGVSVWLFFDLPWLARQCGWTGKHAPLALLDFSGWAYGVEYGIGEWLAPVVTAPDGQRRALHHGPPTTLSRSVLGAVWGLMGSFAHRARPPRAVARRAARAGRLPEDGDVTIVELRKFLSDAEAHSHTDADDDAYFDRWNHRWIVRGHWAWRRCKCHPEPGSEWGRHRVYIDPYIKGPPDAPLVIKERMFAVIR
jgi:hypothetical protein